jgi:hypothetical protein
MTQNTQALKVALAAVQQLPLKLQHQLAERLMKTVMLDTHTTVVYLQRLSPQKQARLAKLMDKNTEGQLSQAEKLELQRLGTEVNQLLLTNSHTLARALRPELFDERGKLLKHRFRRALQESSVGRAERRQANIRE